MGHRLPRVSLAVLALALASGCNEQTNSLPEPPFEAFPDAGPPSGPRDPVLALGQALFFDPELSGNRNISCGTCHVPFLTTAEGIPLALGQGASELGPFRARGTGGIVARHTLDVFHRSDMEVLFWDGRVERLPSGEVVGPVPTPPGITQALELASIVPLLDRTEMRGVPGEVSADRRPNELALLEDDDAFGIWAAIVDRLRAHDGYLRLFAEAFPDAPDFQIQHVAIALAHFQQVLWGPLEARMDFERNEEIERGEELFFGDAGCARCHGGPLFTDQRFYDLAIPQLGPGTEGGLDQGRFDVTGADADRFAFRTPPLRNVALTPPYMHNGSIPTLEAAIRHHFDPVASLRAYTGEHLPESLRATLRTDAELLDQIAANVADAAPLRPLSDAEVASLVAFLEALSNPGELDRHPEDALPVSVPSGLRIDRWNGAPHPFR